MPTGYTQPILNGTIQTFEEFAKDCMKAFGACIHLRDSDDKTYIKRKPSDYSRKRIEETYARINTELSRSNEELVQMEIERSKDRLKFWTELLNQRKGDTEKLYSILIKVKSWTPPTTDHEGLKEFMIRQLEETMKFDCSLSHVFEEIEKVEENLKWVEESSLEECAKKIRLNIRKEIEKDLEYYKENHNKEVERVNEANDWVEVLLNSLERGERRMSNEK